MRVMIFTSVAQHVAFFLTFTSAAVLDPRPIPHLVENLKPRYGGRRGVGNIPVQNVTATPTTTSSDTSTITSMAAWPSYSTSYCAMDPSINTDYCRVHPGTVQVHFWPTGAAAGNHSYPSTFYYSELDVTMTSPSVYYVIDVISATNSCGELIGPPVTNFVHAYDLTAVSTLQPFANAEAKTRMGDPEPLQLSDLRSGCPKVRPSDVPYNNHNTNKDGCNPVLEFNIDLKNAIANGAWRHCGRHWGGKQGLFDPPVPVQPCSGGDCGNVGVEPAPPPPAPTVPPAIPVELPSPPAVPSPSPDPIPVETAAPLPPPPPPAATPKPDPNPIETPQVPTTPPTVPEVPSSTKVESPTPANPIPQSSPTTPPSGPPPSPSSSPTSPEIPENPPPHNPPANDPTPTTPVNNSPVNNPPQTPPAETSAPSLPANSPPPNHPAPAPLPTTPSAIATLPDSGIVISAAPGGTQVHVGTQIVSQGGQPVTVPGAGVISLSPTGIVINNSGSGVVSTIALPPPVVQQQQQPPPTPAAIATLPGSGVIISAAPGASQVTVGTQILSVAGPPITAADGHVVSLSPSGVIVSDPANGVVVTHTLPPPPPAAQTLGVVAGTAIVAIALGSSAAVIGGQTLSLGGPEKTLAGDQVATLGVGGLVIAAPSGVVATMSLPVAGVFIPPPAPTGTGNIANTRPTASTTSSATTTGLGEIIYITYQGEGSRLHLGISGCLVVLGFGVVFNL